MIQYREYIALSNRPVAIVAHRGFWHTAPENSLSAISGAICAGYEIAEIDIQSSKDGILFLLHDRDVDAPGASLRRMTGLSDLANNLTFSQLNELKLKNFDGGEGNSFSDQSIPSLESVLKLADEKIYLDLDVKSLELLVKTSKLGAKMGMQGQAAIKTQVQTYEQAENLKELESKIGVMVMPMMYFSSDDFLEKFDLLQSVSPAMVEAEFDELSTLSLNQNYFKNAGISIWVNTLDPVACCEFNDSSALIDPDSIWGELIRAGVSIIQTDEPEALKKFLSSNVFIDG